MPARVGAEGHPPVGRDLLLAPVNYVVSMVSFRIPLSEVARLTNVGENKCQFIPILAGQPTRGAGLAGVASDFLKADRREF